MKMYKILFALSALLLLIVLSNPELLANNSDKVRQHNLNTALQDCAKGYKVGCNYYIKYK